MRGMILQNGIHGRNLGSRTERLNGNEKRPEWAFFYFIIWLILLAKGTDNGTVRYFGEKYV